MRDPYTQAFQVKADIELLEPSLIAKAKMFLSRPEHQVGIKKKRGHHPHIFDVKCEYCRATVVMAAFAAQILKERGL